MGSVGGRASRARFQLGGVRHGGFVPFTHLPSMPPPEFEPDGSPKKYPLQQPIYDRGYNWETWKLMPVGMFHTVYIGEFARDLPPHWAWLARSRRGPVSRLLSRLGSCARTGFRTWVRLASARS